MSAQVLPFAWGGPPLAGVLRREPADFFVDEQLGFVPDGNGEHVLIHVEKTGANTDWVARQLARHAGVAPNAVSWSGLKDRHAVTRQWFSLQLPGKPSPDWSTLAVDGLRVIDSARHSRKLKRGTHQSNHFRIVIRDIDGDRDAARERIARIAAEGVPNYFGEQRFGRGGDNVDLARALFGGRRMPRDQQGFALSAARSLLFNEVLAARVADGSWNDAIDGDVFMLAGTHSVFGPEPIDDALRRRVADRDIHPTGVLWGRGTPRSEGSARAIEQIVADRHQDLANGLERHGLDQQRRALRLAVQGLVAEWHDDVLTLEFTLDAGSFATVVIRELLIRHQ